MIGKQFKTLEQWTAFMHGKHVIVIKEGHRYYKQRCRFIEMDGANNLISHPDNRNGEAIRMKVKAANGQILRLNIGEFFIEEGLSMIVGSRIINHTQPKTGLNGNLLK